MPSLTSLELRGWDPWQADDASAVPAFLASATFRGLRRFAIDDLEACGPDVDLLLRAPNVLEWLDVGHRWSPRELRGSTLGELARQSLG